MLAVNVINQLEPRNWVYRRAPAKDIAKEELEILGEDLKIYEAYEGGRRRTFQELFNEFAPAFQILQSRDQAAELLERIMIGLAIENLPDHPEAEKDFENPVDLKLPTGQLTVRVYRQSELDFLKTHLGAREGTQEISGFEKNPEESWQEKILSHKIKS